VRLVRGDDRLRPVAVQTVAEADFWPQLGAAMAEPRLPGEPNDALFFSCASQGGTEDYPADENVIDHLSGDQIADFLRRLDACALQARTALQIVGHSMGNRGLLKALELIAQATPQRLAIDRFVFAAPDVDASFLGHGYIASVRALIADLKSLFEAGRAPAGRTGLEPAPELGVWRLK